MQFYFRVDNDYELLLNGAPVLPVVTPGFGLPTPAYLMITSGFLPGANVLRLRVFNAGGPTGFGLGGVFTAQAGRCPNSP
jgi:hypothetical protein